jgi:hypothetical protein
MIKAIVRVVVYFRAAALRRINAVNSVLRVLAASKPKTMSLMGVAGPFWGQSAG